MKKALFLFAILIILLGYHKPVHSQGLSAKRLPADSAYAPSTGVRLALLGSLIYPGFKVGVERPYTFTQLNKQKSQKIKTVYKERYLSYSLGLYHQYHYHTNLFSQVEWIARRQRSKGFYFETSLGLGLCRTFVSGATYTVSEDGEVEKVPLSGIGYALASLGGAVGYNAKLTKQKPYSIYLKHSWLLIFPYNAFITPRPTLELGLNYNLSGFWGAHPSFKTKEKQSRKFRKSQKKIGL